MEIPNINQTMLKMQKNKVLNLLKGLACIGVVFIHVNFPGTTGSIIERLSRFAVPIFFMIAGYFAFGKDSDVIKRRFYKILKIFIFGLFWFLLYDVFIHLLHGDFNKWFFSILQWSTLIDCIVFCNVDFAFALWYLIAMIETYFAWYFIVKYKKERFALWAIPVFFTISIIGTVYLETNYFHWKYCENFFMRSMPYFLFGYYVHSKEPLFKSIRYPLFFGGILTGAIICIIPRIIFTPINFSSIGIILYSLSIFTLAIKIPDKSYCKTLEYIGDKLSLNIYIFHYLIYGVLRFFFKYGLKKNPDSDYGVLGWSFPIIVVLLAVVFAQILEKKMIWLKRC